MPPRTLRSDLLLVKPADADRYVELRDVFEVDGKPVRDRQARLETLLRDPIGAADAQIARHHQRERALQHRQHPAQHQHAADGAACSSTPTTSSASRSSTSSKAKPVFKDARDTAINEAPVFRVSTEMWTIEYQERDGRTRSSAAPTGGDLPAHGRFWINPSNGSVLISELIVDGGGVIATVTVSYQSEPLMGFLVPVEMRESYIRSRRAHFRPRRLRQVPADREISD